MARHRPLGIFLVFSVLVAALSAAPISTGRAGPNAGGTLIVHANPTLEHSFSHDFCGRSELTSCGAVVAGSSSPDPLILHVLASFPVGSTPSLQGVAFGIDYPEGSLAVFDFGGCGSFAFWFGDFSEPGSGVAVSWDAPQTSKLSEVCWLAVENATTEPTTFQLIPHPNFGGIFADGSIPAVYDRIAGFGSFGFGTSGSAPCPGTSALGACCLVGECAHVTPELCTRLDGEYQGGATRCSPGPCGEPCCIGFTRLGPNPFVESIELGFALDHRAEVSLRVYDAQGRSVATLIDGPVSAGDHVTTWDGRFSGGARAARGVYFARLASEGQTREARIVLEQH